MGSIAGFDHLAITVADPEASLAFYRDVLGAEVLYEDRWRSGKLPIFSLQIGANRINVHDAANLTTLVAESPTPGAIDLCFRWSGPIDDAVALLERHDVAIVEGPVFRIASDGAKAVSVYFRDPDDNLIELLTKDSSPPARG